MQETQRIPAQPKYRHQFFQTQKKVEVAVLAKGLTEERVTVDIGESSLLVVIRDQSGSEVQNSNTITLFYPTINL